MQQKVFIGVVLTLVILIFIPLYWATEPGRQAAALERFKTEAVARGAELYTSHCVVCHGPAGEGKIGPALKDSRLDENVLTKRIARGVPGTAMPALSDEEGGPLNEQHIQDLVTFIENWDQSLLKSVPAPPAVSMPMPPPPTPGTEPSPPETPAPVASSINAAELFAEKCAACHGKNREGISGFSPALNPETLAGLSDDQLRDTISGGKLPKGMPSFNNDLSPEEIDALIQFIKQISP